MEVVKTRAESDPIPARCPCRSQLKIANFYGKEELSPPHFKVSTCCFVVVVVRSSHGGAALYDSCCKLANQYPGAEFCRQLKATHAEDK